jgi:hypothetical protein
MPVWDMTKIPTGTLQTLDAFRRKAIRDILNLHEHPNPLRQLRAIDFF